MASHSLGRIPNVGIVGATGAVGTEMIAVMGRRNFSFSDLRLFASPRSSGRMLSVHGKEIPCQVLSQGCFRGLDIVFFDASDAISKEWVPQALEAGCWVVDNSATYRMDPDVPLIVPEINREILELPLKNKLLAGPNCSTVQLVLALFPIERRWGLNRVVVSTFQSVSGAGSLAIDELHSQTRILMDAPGAWGGLFPEVFAHPIAFNCIPQIGKMGPDGFTSEETKIISETRKLLNRLDLRISATAVRVPTIRGHAESVNLELKSRASAQDLVDSLKSQSGVLVIDDLSKPTFAMNLNTAYQDLVTVSRVREDPSVQNGFHLWVVGDNLLKGAALNAIQIGELLL